MGAVRGIWNGSNNARNSPSSVPIESLPTPTHCLHVCVCMSACICMCVYVCIYVCVCVCVYNICMCVYVCVLENWELTLKLPPQCDLIIINTLRHLRMYKGHSREGHACTIMTSYLTGWHCNTDTYIHFIPTFV